MAFEKSVVTTLAELYEKFENIWLISDTHFGHANIIRYSPRPFFSVTDMNESLVRNWNDLVGYSDLVIHLGDVAFCGDTVANSYLDRLAGTKWLVIGNHDYDRKGKLKNLNFNLMMEELVLEVENEHGTNHEFFFTHKPKGKLKDHQYSIHGHLHTYVVGRPGYHNCGVEHSDYKPFPLKIALDSALSDAPQAGLVGDYHKDSDYA